MVPVRPCPVEQCTTIGSLQSSAERNASSTAVSVAEEFCGSWWTSVKYLKKRGGGEVSVASGPPLERTLRAGSPAVGFHEVLVVEAELVVV
jgi:hypothetical protein